MGAIFVIGMHRSGTSLVTRLLEIAGAYVGTEETLMAANEWNETGFWEDMRFANINARLLEEFGGWCWDPPDFPRGWLDDERTKPFYAEGKDLLSRFTPHPTWALKDPRATLVLPFWHRLIERPKHVMCVRNPLDVAASLTKRDGMPEEFGMALWHAYTLRALLDSPAEDRIILLYEEVVRNPLGAASPLFTFVGEADRFGKPETRESIEQSVRSGLKHHDHSLEELLDHPHALASTKRLYEAFVRRDDKALAAEIAGAPETLATLHCITRPCGLVFKAYCDEVGGKRPKPRKRSASCAPSAPQNGLLGTAAGWIAKVQGR